MGADLKDPTAPAKVKRRCSTRVRATCLYANCVSSLLRLLGSEGETRRMHALLHIERRPKRVLYPRRRLQEVYGWIRLQDIARWTTTTMYNTCTIQAYGWRCAQDVLLDSMYNTIHEEPESSLQNLLGYFEEVLKYDSEQPPTFIAFCPLLLQTAHS